MERGIFVPMMIPAFPDNPCSGGGTGTVTSVGITTPAIFAVSNSPITTSGDIAITLVNQSPNLVFASPTTAPAAPPTFRTLVAPDLGTGTATVNTVLRGDMTWGDATSIVGWTPSLNTSAPNNTVNASRLLVNSTSVNGDAVIQPKGTGALLGDLPDGTAVGGDKRGIYCVDLQLARNASGEVASGNYSAILGGYANTVTSTYSVVSGGNNNRISPQPYGFIGGGDSNLVSQSYGVVSGGYQNTNTGIASTVSGGFQNLLQSFDYAVIAGGRSNQLTANYAVIGGGRSNTAQGEYAVIGGGNSNTASGTNSYVFGGSSNIALANSSYVIAGNSNSAEAQFSVAWGQGAKTFSLLQRAFGAISSLQGTKQIEELVLNRSTTATINGNAAIAITVDGLNPGTTNQILIQNNATYSFWGIVTGVGADTSAGTQYNYCAEFKGVVRRINASTITILGCPTVSVLADDSAGKLVFDLQVDTVNNALQLIGQNNVSINAYGSWMVYVKLVKLGV